MSPRHHWPVSLSLDSIMTGLGRLCMRISRARGMAYGRHIYKVSNDAATMLYKIRSGHG